MIKYIILLMPTLLFAGVDFRISPAQYIKKQNVEYIAIANYLKMYNKKHSMKWEYKKFTIDGEGYEIISTNYKRSFKDLYFKYALMKNSSRDEFSGAGDIGYKVNKGFDASLGYVFSKIDKNDHMAALKLNFDLGALKYKYHMRSNFDNRMYEWWQEVSQEFKIMMEISKGDEVVLVKTPFSIDYRIQLDNQFGFTDKAFKVNLIIKL